MVLFILILLVTLLLQPFLPWWSVAPAAALCALLFAKSGKKAFWGGFFAVGLGWLSYALIIHWQTESMLVSRIAEMMSLPYAWLPFLITTLIGGFTGGVSAWAGYILNPKKRNFQRSPYF